MVNGSRWSGVENGLLRDELGAAAVEETGRCRADLIQGVFRPLGGR